MLIILITAMIVWRKESGEILFRKIYSELLDVEEMPEPNDSNEIQIPCPFHDDQVPSFSFNAKDGAWFCFKPDCKKGGGIVELVRELKGLSRKKSKELIKDRWPDLEREYFSGNQSKKSKKEEPPPIEHDEILRWHMILKNSGKVMDWLLNDRGITKDTIERFELGWDGERITIPIYDRDGKIRNVRKYKPNAKDKKVISYKSGYGSARLFPIGNIIFEKVLLCEGELDAILANQLGYKAITATGGAGTWKNEWTEMFTGKIVNVCYDIDDDGQAGAERIARRLYPVTEQAKIIQLPISEPSNADLTDYLVRYGHTKEDLDKLIDETSQYSVEEPTETPSDEKVYEVHLSDASKSKYYFKNVKMNTIVSGKDLAPYIIPRKIDVVCTMDGGKECSFCTMRAAGGEKTFEIEPTDAGILELISCNKKQQKGILRTRLGIPKKCYSYQMEISEAQNVEEIMMMPELDFSSEEREYVIRRGYFIGHGLKPNSSYQMEGITIPDPWRQYATHLIHTAVPSQDNISSFEMTEDKKESLEIFQPGEDQSVEEKFDEIHKDLTYNVTHIYGRKDLLTAMDMVYHSALSFDFQGQRIHRGWVECLIIGDTRTGKSESAQSLMRHYKLGELVTGENTTFAGLIGGMQQTQKRWSITWGKIPLNDRRLVIIDEASGLSEDDIGYMSGVRSSGVAEVTKIQTEKTHARTRLIWISNSRDGRPLKEYGYGIWAIKKLIGKSEDIARFEFAVACASEDVPMETINKKLELHGEVEHKYTYDVCKNLILWAWSRSPEQIEFTEEAVSTILDLATEMGEIYTSKVPLVEGANQRIKLARLAISVAARVFSTDETGETIIVKPKHVEFAHDFIDHQYKDPNMGYYDFSMQQNENERLAREKKDDVIVWLDNHEEVGNLFLQYNSVRKSDLEYMADLERDQVRSIIKFLSSNKMVRKGSRGFYKSPAFGKILKEWKSANEEERNNV